MSIEQDITYTWKYGNQAITATRQIVNANAGALDVYVPTGTNKLPSSFSLAIAKAVSIFMICDQAVTLRSNGTNAIQSVAITGSPTGGTFTLTFGAQTTAALNWNATATQVQAALVALSSIQAGGATCAGGPLPGTPITVTFGALLAVQVVTLMTHTDSLSGGSSPAVAVTTTTAGVAPDTTINVSAGVPLVWDSQAYFAQPFAANTTTLYLSNASGVDANFKLRTLASA